MSISGTHVVLAYKLSYLKGRLDKCCSNQAIIYDNLLSMIFVPQFEELGAKV